MAGPSPGQQQQQQQQQQQEAPYFVRRADPDDVDTLNAMFERTYEAADQAANFASFHGLREPAALGTQAQRQRFFVSLVETCFMSVTVEDEQNNIVGFAALDDAPVQMLNYPGAGTVWEDWFQAVYQEPSVTSATCLWFSCCLSEPEPGIMAEILRTTFSTMPDLQHLFVFVPAQFAEEDAGQVMHPFEAHFHEMLVAVEQPLPPEHWAAGQDQDQRASVLVCHRASIITPLFIRRARVEDHDNLAAVFDAQSEVVTEIYGEYFIAELIEAQNEENKALVAEVDGRAVGLMCLTSDVDANVLAQCFQLDPYDNLLKPHYMQRIRAYSQAVLAGRTDVSLCSAGDYMQVALASIDLPALLDSVPQQEDGRFTAVQFLGQLQLQEFAEELGEALQDFDSRMMTLLWQANFLEPRHEADTIIERKRVTACVKTFLGLDVNARKAIAGSVLDSWEEVADIAQRVREAAASAALADEEGDEDDASKSSPSAARLGGGVSAGVETAVFFRALSVEEQGPFTLDFLCKLVMVLHWWSDEPIDGPLSMVPDDDFRSALEHVLQSEEGLFVGHPSSPAWLANIPQHAKDVFCVNMMCLDQAYQTQALDFLLPAFSLYPEKDYCIITQPHTAPNTPLLNAFTIVPPQPQNTFGHVLYLVHRASLLGPPLVRYLHRDDLPEIQPLIHNFDDATRADIANGIDKYLDHEHLTIDEAQALEDHVLVAEFDEQVIGLIMLQAPEPDTVERLRCCYHLDDYLLVEHHEATNNRGHARLAHFVVNPLFQKFTRRLHQAALRLMGRTVLYAEMDLKATVSPIFRELLQVAPRRPPQLKKALRKPPKVASFVNMEKEVPTVADIRSKERQELLRDATQTKALSIVAKKLLSEMKIPVNARIVVVGASDCGLSFLESLLSIPHLLFNSLTLLAPGGLEYHHAHHLPLVAGSAAYSHHELRRIMLELRVRILDSRMVQVDRQQRCCILHDGSMLPYDYLIVAAGLQDDALHSLKIRSWGVEHVTDGYRRVNGCMSAADSAIRDLLVEGGTLVKSLIWNPLSYAVVYGRSLHAYCVIQGLLMRKVPPTKIILVLPPRLKDASQQLPVDAFEEGDEVESKIHNILTSMNMTVYENYKLLGIQQDNRQRLKALILEDHNVAAQTLPSPLASTVPVNSFQQTIQSNASGGGRAGMASTIQIGRADAAPAATRRPEATKGGLLEEQAPDGQASHMVLPCRILITADSVNVDPDIFNSVHGNGLVYDGRLIVDHHFKTTDDGIFGGGSLCEFSRRFRRKNTERYLRHDGFNGREVGAKLAQALLRVLDPVNGDMAAAGAAPAKPSKGPGSAEETVRRPPGASLDVFTSTDSIEESSPDLLPEFYMPIAKGGFLPGNLHYYRIHSCRRSDLKPDQDEPPEDGSPVTVIQTGEPRVNEAIVTDTLQPNGSGHYCRLTIDSFGKVDSITYLGGEELQVESLWSLVGLSETFLNHLYQRWKDGDIPDIVEFLTDEWATALFHDRFMDFCQQIKLEMLSQEDVKAIINQALDTVNLKEGLSRKLIRSIQEHLPPESVKAMQDHLLEYLRENTNHLKTYFLPENWENPK